MSDCCDNLPETWYRARQNTTISTFYTDSTRQTLENIADKSFRMTVFRIENGEVITLTTISGSGAVPDTETSTCTFTAAASVVPATLTDLKWKFAVDDITDANNPIYKGGGDLIIEIVG